MTGKRRAEPPRRRRDGSESAGEAGPSQPGARSGGADPPAQGASAAGAASPPPGSGRVIAPLKSRRQLRLERRARRRRLGGWGVAGLVALTAVVAAAVGFGVNRITSTAKPPGISQSTLLLQVAGSNGGSVGGVLIGHEEQTHNGVELLVPASLIMSVCGYGEQSFGDILALPDGATKAASALSSVLNNLTIDGTWTLTESQLASLVTAVGGVTVDVDVNVTKPGPHGTAIVDIPQGRQQLTGTQAAEFAAYRASTGEDASAQLARLQSVVQAAIDKLPRSAAGASTILKRLGPGAASSLGINRLASLLVGVGADDRHDGGVLASDLPTTAIDTGGAPSYNINSGQAQQFVRENFAASLPKQRRTGLKVLVQNGYGTPGLVPSACQRLAAAGMQVTSGGNSGTGQLKSQVLVNDRTVADATEGQRVARALRLPKSAVQVNPLPPNGEDVVVVLGKDYRP